MDQFEQSLRSITVAPYIVKATALIGIRRKSGSNMFRHQINTFGILLDYKVTDPVLLKAACLHDLFEDAGHLPGVTEAEIKQLDADGPAVYDLVIEVSIRRENGIKESKKDFLQRVMQTGSEKAKLLKLADRISNLCDLGFVNEIQFIKKYLKETKEYILPYAAAVNKNMFIELTDLVKNRELLLHQLVQDTPPQVKPSENHKINSGSWSWLERLMGLFHSAG